MTPTPFPEQTAVLGAPPGWDAVQRGPCGGLPVYHDWEGGMFASVWRPSWRERLALLFGGRVWLWVVSDAHPPVMLEAQRKGRT